MADTNKEQLSAALNTLINLSLQIAREQQAQVQNAVNVLAPALDLVEKETSSDDPADHVEKDQSRSDAKADADALPSGPTD